MARLLARTSARPSDRRFVIGVLAALSMACATTGSRTATIDFVGNTALAPGEQLEALPDSATFAWVDPTNSILHATAADDRHRDDPGIPGLREDVSIVLRSHHWSEVSADDAMYKLTLARIDRPDPARNNIARNSGVLPATTLKVCTGAVGERKDVNCTTRPVDIRNSDGLAAETRYGSWVVFVIRRRDGAHHAMQRQLVWDAQPADFDFASATLNLLRSGRRAR